MAAACEECRGLFSSVPCSKCEAKFGPVEAPAPVVEDPVPAEDPATEGESEGDEAGQDAE